MPGKYLTDILRNLIPLQEVGPLLDKVVEAAREVSGADRCLLLHWDHAADGWRSLAAGPAESAAPSPFAPDLSREVLRHKAAGSWSRRDGVPYPFGPDPGATGAVLTAPLVFPSSNELYGVLYADTALPREAFGPGALSDLASFANLAALCLENAVLFEKASVDEVTRAFTKAFFLNRLEEEYHRALRSGGSFALFMTDVDDFKRINDTHGHLAGDRILRTFVETLKRNTRIYDLVGRYGGDEFMVLMPGLDFRNLYPVAEKLSQALAAAEYPVPGPVTFSFGGAVYPAHAAASGMDLLLQADMALYQAKGQGKGRIVILGRETPILSSLSPLTRDAAEQKVDTKALVHLDNLAEELARAVGSLPGHAECPKVRELAGLILEQVRSVFQQG
jgi:diguanylate cyclase (GGDEF)-like protein